MSARAGSGAADPAEINRLLMEALPSSAHHLPFAPLGRRRPPLALMRARIRMSNRWRLQPQMEARERLHRLLFGPLWYVEEPTQTRTLGERT